ncbi:hypothetical protein J4E91_009735 [Alternaria rosae]|nr:hypothetical protein J4E91_009735 [Alternaria rosae]
MRETNGPHTYPLVWDVDNPPESDEGERTQYDVNTATFKKFTADKPIREEEQVALFEKLVPSGLREGIKGPKIVEQVPLRSNAQALEDDHTYAYLIHPAPSPDNRNGYQLEAQKIRAVVEEFLPKLKSPGRWTLVPYVVEDDETLEELYFSMILKEQIPSDEDTGRRK